MSGQTEAHAGNIGLAIWRLKCFYETFVQGSTAVILFNLGAKTRHIAKPKTVVRKLMARKKFSSSFNLCESFIMAKHVSGSRGQFAIVMKVLPGSKSTVNNVTHA